MKKLILLAIVLFIVLSCTDNARARRFGGSETLDLQPNHELLGITWKESDMWILTRDTTTGINYFKEKSSWGLLEGTIILKPNKQ